ncbi:hypothetical protein [Mycolicibacterium goodii]|uniref:Uncharacterized protein n=1 Tax=Mycolicibacterium goodii TaxID=134601 RepID=A0A0K0X2X9_MYCGD|nr:hypothetical protein AFA91_07700 [Mycolicibacterium goodii]
MTSFAANPVVDSLHRLIDNLMHQVSALESTHGRVPAVHRVVNDVERIRNGIERLKIDLADLAPSSTRPSSAPAEKIQIPDADYGIDFWRDVDHEGIGAQSLAAVRRHP